MKFQLCPKEDQNTLLILHYALKIEAPNPIHQFTLIAQPAAHLTLVAIADTAAVLFAVMTFPSMTLEEVETVNKGHPCSLLLKRREAALKK